VDRASQQRTCRGFPRDAVHSLFIESKKVITIRDCVLFRQPVSVHVASRFSNRLYEKTGLTWGSPVDCWR